MPTNMPNTALSKMKEIAEGEDWAKISNAELAAKDERITELAADLESANANLESYRARDISLAEVGEIEPQAETGDEITPEPVVTIGDNVLVKDTDYALSYADNTEAGTATVTITGKGAMFGHKTVEFEIVEDDDEDEDGE